MAGRQRQRYLIIALALIFIAGLFVATAYVYTQGTLFDIGCDWQTVEHPDTGEPFSTVADYEQALQNEADISDEELATHLDRIETRVRSGQVQVRLTECAQGTGSGEVNG